MQSLSLIFIAHAALRFPGDSVLGATIMCGALALCMAVVARFGGWASMAGAAGWLRSHPGFVILLVANAIIFTVIGFVAGDAVRLHHLLAYQIEVFFFGYAFLAGLQAFWSAGIESIASWFRR